MQTIAFCERDEFCRDVLAKHWPSVPCFEDIHDLDAGRLGGLGRVDLVCGGFPCQPFSQAGEQRAIADDRYLWPAMREVIALARPTWVIGENVTGIIALALDDVLADLEGLGYAARAFVIPACAVGALHRRDRVWIIARDPDEKGESVGAEYAEMAELRSSMAHTDGQGLEGRFSSPSAQAAERTTERSGGFHGWWESEPGVGRVAARVPHRMDRLRALGNAVVPQVVYELGRAIMTAHNSI